MRTIEERVAGLLVDLGEGIRGVTIRDLFAASSLAGHRAHTPMASDALATARAAYVDADAMMQERIASSQRTPSNGAGA